MDVSGGMGSDIYDSMAEGVQGACCIVAFLTQQYQDSANCKLELQFAEQSGVQICAVSHSGAGFWTSSVAPDEPDLLLFAAACFFHLKDYKVGTRHSPLLHTTRPVRSAS